METRNEGERVEIKYKRFINVRILTIDVNGEKSCLTFKEATNGDEEESAVEMVEEENPDCVILVYAIDDRETFGE